MATLDVDRLLEPISEESPCGPNLEYDDLYASFEKAGRGKAEQQYGDTIIPAEEPNWREVRQFGIELVERTKDLRIGCLLARGLLETDGLPAFAESLALVRGYLVRYWPTVHPQLDPEDENDPTLRVNTISSLSDQVTTIKSLRTVPMVSARALGRFSLRDLAIANGDVPPVPGVEPPKFSTIEAAFMECDLDQLKGDAAAVHQCFELADSIEAAVTEQVGAARAVSLDGLRDTLKELCVILDEYVSRRDISVVGEAAGEEGAAADGAGQPAGRLTGEIRSREDVVTALDKICQYYDRWEPSSPLPLLLRRAKRLASKNFLEIVKDLSPDAVSQVRALGGVDEEESAD